MGVERYNLVHYPDQDCGGHFAAFERPELSDGTPVGNLPYAAMCFVLVALCLTAAMTARSPRSVTVALAA